MKHELMAALLIAAAASWTPAVCGEEGGKASEETPGGQAMEQYMSVSLLRGQMPAGKKLSKETFIPEISVVKDAMKAKKPALVLFTVASNGDPKDEDNKKAVKHTNNARAEVFSGKQPSWNVGLLTKFVLSVEIDITRVTEKENYFFNSKKGPAVLVTGPDGKQVALIDAEKVDPDDVARALTKALDISNVDSKAILARLNKEVKALATAQAGASKLEKEQIVMMGQISRSTDLKAKAVMEKQRQVKAAEAVKLKEEITRLKKMIEELPLAKPAK